MKEIDYFIFIKRTVYIFLLYGVVLGIAIASRDSQDTKTLYQYIQDWKELISAGVALFGAWLAYRAATYQYINEKDRQAEQFLRENIASRSILPLALSDVGKYSEECLKYISSYENFRSGRNPLEPNRPRLGQETLKILREAILFSDETHQKKISRLIGEIQINESRIDTYISECPGRPYRITRLYRQYDCLNIYNLSSNLFNYARIYRDDEIKPKEQSMEGASNILMRYIEDIDEMDALIRLRTPGGAG